VSTYFRNFFFGQWKEKGQEQFVIHEEEDPHFDIRSFRLMIYATLSLGWMVPELLKLFKGLHGFKVVPQITLEETGLNDYITGFFRLTDRIICPVSRINFI
jgi:hypothetical protein